MNIKKIIIAITGIATLIVIDFTIYKGLFGKEIGFSDVTSISIAFMMLFSAITWGNKNEDDGILQEEELGKKITDESSKIGYFILTGFIFIAVIVDKVISGTFNMVLVILLSLAMMTLPLVEFIISKKYQ